MSKKNPLEEHSQRLELAGVEKNIKKATSALNELYGEYLRLFGFVFSHRKITLTESI